MFDLYEMTHRICILGSGISGLTAAYKIQRACPNVRITLLEKESRVGGWFNGFVAQTGYTNASYSLLSSQSQIKNLYYFELGAHSMRPAGDNGASVLRLITELGILAKAIPTDTSSNMRYIYRHNELQKLPTSIQEIIFNPLTRNLPFVFLNEIFTARRATDDETIFSFFSRHFGESFTNTLVSSMISGIFAGDIKKLSIRSCFPLVYNMERSHRSLVWYAMNTALTNNSREDILIKDIPEHLHLHYALLKNATGISFQKGISFLTNSIYESLHRSANVDIHFDEPVEAIENDNNGKILVKSSKSTICCDKVISAIPLHNLLPSIPFTSNSGIDSKLEYVSVAVANLGYDDFCLPKPGFGHLLPSSENNPILGMIYDSNVFPSQGDSKNSTLTVMLGGAHHSNISDFSSDEILKIALNGVKTQLGIERKPSAAHVSFIDKAIPQYLVGYQEAKNHFASELETHFNGQFYLLGNNFCGAGIADSIHSATHLSMTCILKK